MDLHHARLNNAVVIMPGDATKYLMVIYLSMQKQSDSSLLNLAGPSSTMQRLNLRCTAGVHLIYMLIQDLVMSANLAN
jgi:hypothetical protein